MIVRGWVHPQHPRDIPPAVKAWLGPVDRVVSGGGS